MRPRHKAAENPREHPDLEPAPIEASMRPRHKAAENRMSRVHTLHRRNGFNEAAA